MPMSTPNPSYPLPPELKNAAIQQVHERVLSSACASCTSCSKPQKPPGHKHPQPHCPCLMDALVATIDKNYYEVCFHHTPDGVVPTVGLLGPVGGPYR